jgi:hypothetical protein
MSQLQPSLEAFVVDAAPLQFNHHLFEHVTDAAIASLYTPSNFLPRLVFSIYPHL